MLNLATNAPANAPSYPYTTGSGTLSEPYILHLSADFTLYVGGTTERDTSTPFVREGLPCTSIDYKASGLSYSTRTDQNVLVSKSGCELSYVEYTAKQVLGAADSYELNYDSGAHMIATSTEGILPQNSPQGNYVPPITENWKLRGHMTFSTSFFNFTSAWKSHEGTIRAWDDRDILSLVPMTYAIRGLEFTKTYQDPAAPDGTFNPNNEASLVATESGVNRSPTGFSQWTHAYGGTELEDDFLLWSYVNSVIGCPDCHVPATNYTQSEPRY